MSISIPPRLAPALPPPSPQPVKAGPLGPGAGVLNTEYPLALLLGTSAQKKMRKAYQLGISVPWIRAAERVIAGDCSTAEWYLEDDKGETVDAAYPKPLVREAFTLTAYPQAELAIGRKLTRRELWYMTIRHVGLCGNSFWLLDEPNVYGIPRSILYIRPDRMFPVEDKAGNLLGWKIDADRETTAGVWGIPVELDQIVQFVLEPPDEGHFGAGLVESALLKAQIATSDDKHVATVLDAGGRLAGLLSPKGTVQVESPDVWAQMIRDWRTVVEQPDAAKRLQVLATPMDFTQTTMTLKDLDAVELMRQSRDDLLALWGVPLSQIGGATPAGLNSGDTRKYDEAALWQHANHPRLVGFTETYQLHVLDKFAEFGTPVTLTIEEPEFDDDSPRYDLLGKSLNTAMTNRERRDLVGLPPTGDPAIDDAILLPVALTLYAQAPAEPAATPTERAQGTAPVEDNVAAGNAAGETSSAPKAGLRDSLTSLREHLDRVYTPKVRVAVEAVLEDQQRVTAQKLRTNAAHVARNPRDTSVWWDQAHWNERMRAAIAGPAQGMAQAVNSHIAMALQPEGKADPLEVVTTRGVTRVQAINERTRNAILSMLLQGLEEDLTILALADAMGTVKLDGGTPAFDPYRAEMIARTELMDAYNVSAVTTYEDAGIGQVQAIDGDGDEVCAARNGQVFTTAEALDIEDHPNGTLDWVPVIAGFDDSPPLAASTGKAQKALIADATPEPAWLPVLIAALSRKAEPIAVTVVTGDSETRQTETVIEYDANGDYAGYREVAAVARDTDGDIVMEA